MNIDKEEIKQKTMSEMMDNNEKKEEDIIREVAEEEGMTYEEVKEVWDLFKSEAQELRNYRGKAKKSKSNNEKVKSRKKQAKKSKKRNR